MFSEDLITYVNQYFQKNGPRLLDKNCESYWKEIIIKETSFLDKNCRFSERIYCILNNQTSLHLCEYCKINETKYIGIILGYRTYCSRKCTSVATRDKSKETLLNNFGVDNPMKSSIIRDKVKRTNLERYGYEHSSKNNKVKEKIKISLNQIDKKEVLKKTKQTNLRKYGCECIFHSEEIRNKSKQTLLEHYGVDNPTKSPIIQQKIRESYLEKYGKHFLSLDIIKNKRKETNLEKYGAENVSQVPKISSKIKTTKKSNYYNILIEKLEKKKISVKFNLEEFIVSSEWEFHCNRCRRDFWSIESNPQRIICKCTRNSSKYEDEIEKSLKPHSYLKNYRSLIYPYEVDFYFPDYKFAIEFNGLYWHSTLYRDKNYHLNKWRMCKEKGVQLIQIFQNEWDNKSNIINSLIQSKLKNFIFSVDASECEIKEISSEKYKCFCDENHIFGSDEALIRLGLMFNNELIFIIGIQQLNDNEFELTKICSKLNMQILNSFSKLLKYFKENFWFEKLVSYVDLRYFDEEELVMNGFVFVEHTEVRCLYWKKHSKELSFHVVGEDDYLRIYDCGSLKLEMKRNFF